jgi:hypothetical protein
LPGSVSCRYCFWAAAASSDFRKTAPADSRARPSRPISIQRHLGTIRRCRPDGGTFIHTVSQRVRRNCGRQVFRHGLGNAAEVGRSHDRRTAGLRDCQKTGPVVSPAQRLATECSRYTT